MILIHPCFSSKQFLNVLTIFLSEQATVTGPTPPGTGVIFPTFSLTEFDLSEQTSVRIKGRRKITQKTRFKSFKELGIFNSLGDCLYYATFPDVKYLSNMYSNIYIDIQLVE